MTSIKSFASDNYAGVLPQVMEALQQANQHHAPSYGADALSKEVAGRIGRWLGAPGAEVLFVFNGTGANVLSISAATRSFHAVLCASTSHIYNDESSAPESFTGCRIIALPANDDGKLEPQTVLNALVRKGDVHFAQPKLLSITQSTEYGTLYTQEEIRALSVICREHGLYLHMDGSRFFNAAAALDCAPADISAAAGVDILSLGGTKLGMIFGEAVVVFNKELSPFIRYQHKQLMQLASKTRFIAAQFDALLTDDLWRTTAAHANAMARLLEAALSRHPQVHITRPVQANAIFAELPAAWTEPLQQLFPFYVWKEATNEVRLMCAFDTTEADIRAFDEALCRIAGHITL
jgi:threonine aldolase